MREIKARAWDDKAKKWLDPNAFVIDPRGNLDPKGCQIYSVGESLQPEIGGVENQDSIILELFTGHHDKNGQEIYEGDIIRFHNEGWVDSTVAWVFYSSRETAFIFRYDLDPKNQNYYTIKERSFDFSDIDGVPIQSDDMEKIGNIHEHPNMLKALK